MKMQNIWKLDGVGPIDNRPSTDKLQHYIYIYIRAASRIGEVLAVPQ